MNFENIIFISYYNLGKILFPWSKEYEKEKVRYHL